MFLLHLGVGCKAQRTGKIAYIDINEEKFETSKKFIVAECGQTYRAASGWSD